MAIIYQKQPKKFSFFFKICMIFIILGIVLHFFGLMFWGELSYFIGCTVIIAGIEYIILHHITYITGKKIERVVSVLFYTGVVCLVLELFSSLIFKEDYYVDISPFMEMHGFIIFCLSVGAVLLPVSVVIMLLKYGKLIKFLNDLF